ncbi:extracellular solute-binding protein, partial [Vibrio nigripulchritudo ATCC 27043]
MEDVMKRFLGSNKLKMAIGFACLTTSMSAAYAADDNVLRVKLIGGAQYEPLYTLIPKWERKTGMKVEVLSRKNHFELDREIKQDIAANNINYCVASNHTSFAPQYGSIYTDLRKLIGSNVLDEFVPLTLEHGTIDGRLVQLPRHSDISNLYYKKSLFENQDNQAKFKAKYGYDLAPPATW